MDVALFPLSFFVFSDAVSLVDTTWHMDTVTYRMGMSRWNIVVVSPFYSQRYVKSRHDHTLRVYEVVLA